MCRILHFSYFYGRGYLHHGGVPKVEFSACVHHGGVPKVEFNTCVHHDGVPKVEFSAWVHHGGVPKVEFSACVHHSGVPKVEFNACVHHGGVPKVEFTTCIHHGGVTKEESIACEHHGVLSNGEFIPYIYLSTKWCTWQWCTQGRLHSLRTPGYSVPLVDYIYCVHHGGVFKVEGFACVHHDWFPVVGYPRVFSCVACTAVV